MKKLFNEIMVPVIPGDDPEIILEEGVLLAEKLYCRLHIVYFFEEETAWALARYDELKADIQNRYMSRLGSPLSLVISLQTAPPVRGITEYCNRYGIDLLLLTRRRKTLGTLFKPAGLENMAQVLKKVNCAVLTLSTARPVTAMSGLGALKNIVLPVGDLLPMQKLMFAAYLARISHSTIHLIGAGGRTGGQEGGARESMEKSYRLLRENTNLPVHCQTMPGENLGRITWNYARKIKADLILIGPGKESVLSGFIHDLWSRWFPWVCSRSLLTVSRIPVLFIIHRL